MKQAYQMPRLAEYGDVFEMTLGSGGSVPDYDANTLQHINNNADCITAPRQHICFSNPGQILGGFS